MSGYENSRRHKGGNSGNRTESCWKLPASLEIDVFFGEVGLSGPPVITGNIMHHNHFGTAQAHRTAADQCRRSSGLWLTPSQLC